MQSEAQEWFAARTSAANDWPVADLLVAKQAQRVDVILPALNEAATVGQIVSEVRSRLMQPGRSLVDALVVVDCFPMMSKHADDAHGALREFSVTLTEAHLHG